MYYVHVHVYCIMYMCTVLYTCRYVLCTCGCILYYIHVDMYYVHVDMYYVDYVHRMYNIHVGVSYVNVGVSVLATSLLCVVPFLHA